MGGKCEGRGGAARSRGEKERMERGARETSGERAGALSLAVNELRGEGFGTVWNFPFQRGCEPGPMGC